MTDVLTVPTGFGQWRRSAGSCIGPVPFSGAKETSLGYVRPVVPRQVQDGRLLVTATELVTIIK